MAAVSKRLVQLGIDSGFQATSMKNNVYGFATTFLVPKQSRCDYTYRRHLSQLVNPNGRRVFLVDTLALRKSEGVKTRSRSKMVAVKLVPDCSNAITAIKPSSLLNSLFNHRHPTPNGAFCHSRSFQQATRSLNTIRAYALNCRDFIADTATAVATLSLVPMIGLDNTSFAKADDLSEWERVYLPI